MSLLGPSLFPSKRGRTRVLSSECKTDQADFPDWMSFLPSNLMEEINPIREALTNKSFLSIEQLKGKKRFRYKCLNIVKEIAYL